MRDKSVCEKVSKLIKSTKQSICENSHLIFLGIKALTTLAVKLLYPSCARLDSNVHMLEWVSTNMLFLTNLWLECNMTFYTAKSCAIVTSIVVWGSHSL